MHWRVLARTKRGPESFSIGSTTQYSSANDSRPLFDGTWLEVQLETGRTHQIRVQAASRGHAVVGDTQYGATQSFGEQIRG